ncbi:MAG: hypothetical protein QJR09_03335 [Micrococcus sp.]|nr:hypothetical protein [Micrococcus sp.]
MTNARAHAARSPRGEASFAGPPPDPDPGPGPAAGPEPRCARIAQAAATGLMTHTDVDDAVVRIDGPGHAPRLWIECLLAPDGDVTRTTELVVGVREQLEAMLDLTFDTAEMTIRNVAGQG